MVSIPDVPDASAQLLADLLAWLGVSVRNLSPAATRCAREVVFERRVRVVEGASYDPGLGARERQGALVSARVSRIS